MPSPVAAVLNATNKALQRFPLVVSAGVTAAIAASIGVGHGEHPDAIRLVATSTLALPLLFAVAILTERRRGHPSRWLLLLVAIVVLVAFYIAWPGWTADIQGYRYVQLSLAFHLFAAFSPFVRSASTNGFWQYNKALFLRGLMAVLYAGVLFVGLAIAIAAIERLFALRMPEATYIRLWCVLAFVFSTCFFVSGVPEDLDALEAQTDYPNELRAFTQFVLVPLVAVYLAIQMVYLGKVLVTQQWPNGWIGYLVSSVAVVGILAWLLVHPLEDRAEYRWVKPFTKGFYIALMPAIVMLWMAIWQRAHQYGITERRYFLIVLTVWLAATAVYYTVSKSRNIKLIPASLCLLALVTFAGPTGAYAVSRASQLGRLRTVLERDGLLVNGRLQRATGSVPDSDRVAISAGFRYLTEIHGYRVVAAWLPDSLLKSFATASDTTRSASADRDARAIMASINVAYAPIARGPAAKGGGTYISYTAGFMPATVPIAGFTHAVHLTPFLPAVPNDTITVDAHTMVRVSRDDAVIHVLRDGQSVIDMPLRSAIDSAAAVPQPDRQAEPRQPTLRIEASAGGITAVLYVTSAQGTDQHGKLTLSSIGGELLLRLPQ